MPDLQAQFQVNQPHEDLSILSQGTSTPQSVSLPEAPLQIPDDVTVRVEEVDQAAEAAAAVVLRSSERQPKETTLEHNERIKREFTAQVMEARHQANKPPPPPQPVARAIQDQTRLEMAAGAKQSAHWAEQQKQRPAPSPKDIAAMGHTVPVFQPDVYTHEKGQGFAGKNLTTHNMPGR